MKRFIILIIILSLSITTTIFGQSGHTAGKIRGRITDQLSGEPLAGANILLKDTQIGTATNVQGEYLLSNIAAGKYDIVVSYIGYSSKIFKDVNIYPGQTNSLNIALEIQAVEGEVVEVVAEAQRNIIAVREPSTQTRITGKDLTRMPASDFTDIVANSSGAVETEGGRSRGIHMRGGRSGEVAFYVDGVMVNDPVDHSVGMEIDNNAIEQMVISRSGFSAEHGNAMSGSVSIITKSGSKKYHSGRLEVESDSYPAKIDNNLNYGYDKYRYSINGPIPFTKGTTTYYLFGTHEDTDIASPKPITKSHNSIVSPNANAKIIFSPKYSPFKATLSGGFDREEYLSYSHNISKGNWLKDYYKMNSGHDRVSLKLQSTISKHTAWSLILSYYNTFNEYGSGEGSHYKDFKYISTRLDWVANAVNNEWYDPETRNWEAIQDQAGFDLIRDSFVTPDGTPIASMDAMEQAYYYYYADLGYYDMENGTWDNADWEAEAKNAHYHDAHQWYIPSELDPESNFYNANDNSVKYREFNEDEYSDYLFMHPDSQSVYDMWGYGGDLHNGYYWDRDLFNVFTFGPGRPRFHNQDTKLLTSEFHINSQINMFNELKFGWKVEKGELHYVDMQFANQNPYFDSYNYNPVSGASWLENIFEYEDMIVNLGLRYDYFNSHAKSLSDPDNFDTGKDGKVNENEEGFDPILNPDPNGDDYDELTNPSGTEGDGGVDYKEATPKHQFSPRFGISFSVSDKTSMYANYGHFFQTPEYGEIYQNLSTDLTSGFPLVGNPNIDPEHTTQYEVGLKHRFNTNLALELSAYYKDAENLLATRTYSTIFNGQIATVTFQETQDYAKIKGIDLKLTMRGFYGLNGEVSYSYLNAKGTGSSSREFYYLYIFEIDRPLPVKEYPLEFDITHSLKGNLNYFLPAGFGPSFFGIRPMQNFNANLQFYINSGRPYTPTDRYDKPLELGSRRMPTTYRFDLRLEKFIRLIGRSELSVYLDMRNIFNTENLAWVYPYSGKPDDNGKAIPRNEYVLRNAIGEIDPTTGNRITDSDEAYEAQVRLNKQLRNSPSNYGRPRIARLGVSLTF